MHLIKNVYISMQLGLDCQSSTAPHSATLVPAFQENREALTAALLESAGLT